jgi:hypothetical protein
MTVAPNTPAAAGYPAPTDPASARSEAQPQRLRRLIREQPAGAVAEQRLDIDVADGMLTVSALPARLL